MYKYLAYAFIFLVTILGASATWSYNNNRNFGFIFESMGNMTAWRSTAINHRINVSAPLYIYNLSPNLTMIFSHESSFNTIVFNITQNVSVSDPVWKFQMYRGTDSNIIGSYNSTYWQDVVITDDTTNNFTKLGIGYINWTWQLNFTTARIFSSSLSYGGFALRIVLVNYTVYEQGGYFNANQTYLKDMGYTASGTGNTLENLYTFAAKNNTEFVNLTCFITTQFRYSTSTSDPSPYSCLLEGNLYINGTFELVNYNTLYVGNSTPGVGGSIFLPLNSTIQLGRVYEPKQITYNGATLAYNPTNVNQPGGYNYWTGNLLIYNSKFLKLYGNYQNPAINGNVDIRDSFLESPGTAGNIYAFWDDCNGTISNTNIVTSNLYFYNSAVTLNNMRLGLTSRGLGTALTRDLATYGSYNAIIKNMDLNYFALARSSTSAQQQLINIKNYNSTFLSVSNGSSTADEGQNIYYEVNITVKDTLNNVLSDVKLEASNNCYTQTLTTNWNTRYNYNAAFSTQAYLNILTGQSSATTNFSQHMPIQNGTLIWVNGEIINATSQRTGAEGRYGFLMKKNWTGSLINHTQVNMHSLLELHDSLYSNSQGYFTDKINNTLTLNIYWSGSKYIATGNEPLTTAWCSEYNFTLSKPGYINVTWSYNLTKQVDWLVVLLNESEYSGGGVSMPIKTIIFDKRSSSILTMK